MSDGYKIGQVLFVIPTGGAAVVPIQVIERRISETSSGIVVKHIVKTHKEKSPMLVLETIKGDVYDDVRRARETMLSHATRAIDSMIKKALDAAAQSFEQKRTPPLTRGLHDGDLVGSIDDDVQTNERSSDTQGLRMSTPSVDDVVEGDDGRVEIMLPDGTKQRVRVKARAS